MTKTGSPFSFVRGDPEATSGSVIAEFACKMNDNIIFRKITWKGLRHVDYTCTDEPPFALSFTFLSFCSVSAAAVAPSVKKILLRPVFSSISDESYVYSCAIVRVCVSTV